MITSPDVVPEDIFNTAMMHLSAQRRAEAIMCFDQALLRKPDYWQAWGNRGGVLSQLGNNFDAILNFNQALAIKPDQPEFLCNRGSTWIDLGAFEKGLEDYRRAIEVAPRMKEAHLNMGNALQWKDDIAGALSKYLEAFEIDPSYVDAELYAGMMELNLGLLEKGWKHFDARWRCGQLPLRDFDCPIWGGEDLNGKRFLLFGEQGLGDMVQFIRYATVIRKQYPDAFIAVEVRRTLQRLAATVPGVDQVLVYGEPYEKFDYACPMISAARFCGTNTLDDIPAWPRYMTPPAYRVEKWRKDIAKEIAPFNPDALLVGICWAGMGRPLMPQANAIDARRSTHLSQWAPLANLQESKNRDIIYVSLQAGGPAEQAKSPPPGMTLSSNSEDFEDFADTAALMECLDLVITVDTAVCHVAAAIGRPTWMLSRFDGCWRWHGNRSDSPWYPTLRQFRQPRLKDWDPVFGEVAFELRKFAAQRKMKEAAE